MEDRGQPDLFATTRWTMIRAAGGDDTAAARAALADLCRQYWHPLYAYTRRCGCAPEDAEDLTQSFFARAFAKEGANLLLGARRVDRIEAVAEECRASRWSRSGRP